MESEFGQKCTSCHRIHAFIKLCFHKIGPTRLVQVALPKTAGSMSSMKLVAAKILQSS